MKLIFRCIRVNSILKDFKLIELQENDKTHLILFSDGSGACNNYSYELIEKHRLYLHKKYHTWWETNDKALYDLIESLSRISEY